MDDDDDYSKTCGPVMDRRNPVNLDELFVPLKVKSKECDNLVAVTEEESAAAEDDADNESPSEAATSETITAVVTAAKATNLVNDINTRFSNDHTQTVGPYLEVVDPSRKVSVHDLFKPLDSKSKEMQNLAEESSSDDIGCDGGGGGDDYNHKQTAGAGHDSEPPPPQQTQTCGPVIIDSNNHPVKQNLERIFDQNPDEVHDTL